MNSSQVLFRQARIRRGLVFGVIIVTALFAFEIFNYSTTEFALSDLLGELSFVGVRWATILAIAFCGIDFAGIARLFTPNDGGGEPSAGPNESWYLFGAWLLAATMNAMLTWWGVSLAILDHQTLGNEVVSRETMLRVAPVFVAVLVWLIRVLIIGTFSVAGDRLFNQTSERTSVSNRPPLRPQVLQQPAPRPASLRQVTNAASLKPSVKASAASQPEMFGGSRPEPTYHSLSASSNSAQMASGAQNLGVTNQVNPTPSRSNILRSGPQLRR